MNFSTTSGFPSTNSFLATITPVISHNRIRKTHIQEKPCIELDGVVEKFLFIVDAGYPIPGQHHLILLLRVRPALFQRYDAAQYLIVIGRLSLKGHDLVPPTRHPVVLGEKAVAADVHAVAVVAHSSGDAAYLLAFLKDQYLVFL